ncbi:type VI secretion system contractile sheath large subunit [Vibrio lentus]|nr:type VI secretion system contractile sheath large subunit [Vibrio lentus]
MTQAYTASGWCTSIRGLDNGGKGRESSKLTYKSEAGDLLQQCQQKLT